MAQTDQLMGIKGTLDFALELIGGKMFFYVPWVFRGSKDTPNNHFRKGIQSESKQPKTKIIH